MRQEPDPLEGERRRIRVNAGVATSGGLWRRSSSGLPSADQPISIQKGGNVNRRPIPISVTARRHGVRDSIC